jgi:hypothetical protein
MGLLLLLLLLLGVRGSAGRAAHTTFVSAVVQRCENSACCCGELVVATTPTAHASPLVGGVDEHPQEQQPDGIAGMHAAAGLLHTPVQAAPQSDLMLMAAGGCTVSAVCEAQTALEPAGPVSCPDAN